MGISGVLGAKLYIADTPLLNLDPVFTYDFSFFPLDIEVGLIESFGELGRSFNSVKFESFNTGRTTVLKTSFDDGSFQFTVAQSLDSEGQELLKQYASESGQDVYAFKIKLNGNDTDFDTIYFGAKVLGYKTQLGGVNNVVKAIAGLAIMTEIFTGPEGELMPESVIRTNRSGTITLGGSAQVLMPANSVRHGYEIQNLSTGDLWINFDGATAIPSEPSFWLPAGSSCENPLLSITNTAISIYGATTGQAFTAYEW